MLIEEIQIPLREEIFEELNFAIQRKICEFRGGGNFESFAEFNFVVEQYVTKFFAQKVTFQ